MRSYIGLHRNQDKKNISQLPLSLQRQYADDSHYVDLFYYLSARHDVVEFNKPCWQNFLKDGQPLVLEQPMDRKTQAFLSMLWTAFPSLHTDLIQYVDLIYFVPTFSSNMRCSTSVLVSYKNSIQYLDHPNVRAIDFKEYYSLQASDLEGIIAKTQHYSLLQQREFLRSVINKIDDKWDHSRLLSHFRNMIFHIITELDANSKDQNIVAYAAYHLQSDPNFYHAFISSDYFSIVHPKAHEKIHTVDPFLFECCSTLQECLNYLEHGILPSMTAVGSTDEMNLIM